MKGKKLLKVSIGVFYRFERGKPFVFLQRRDEEGQFEGKLEFPGGKIEKGESPVDALVREIDEELGVKIKKEDATLFKLKPFEYPKSNVLLYTFVIKKNTNLKSWYALDDFASFREETFAANQEIFENLTTFFGKSEESFREFESVLWP